jgi:hypothetical protein
MEKEGMEERVPGDTPCQSRDATKEVVHVTKEGVSIATTTVVLTSPPYLVMIPASFVAYGWVRATLSEERATLPVVLLTQTVAARQARPAGEAVPWTCRNKGDSLMTRSALLRTAAAAALVLVLLAPSAALAQGRSSAVQEDHAGWLASVWTFLADLLLGGETLDNRCGIDPNGSCEPGS